MSEVQEARLREPFDVARKAIGPSVPKPFLKWAGGKTQLLPELDKHIPKKFGRYFEPFLGGGALYFHLIATGQLMGEDAVLNDLNDQLVATYSQVRDAVKRVAVRLEIHQENYRKRGEAYFYAVRSTAPAAGPDVAARFIFLNRTCFNGLWRENKRGEFNVPHGKYKNPTICAEETLRVASLALRGVTLRTGDFHKMCFAFKGPRRGDFVYFDPPYFPVGGEADFTSYTKVGFYPNDQEQLARDAKELKKQGVRVLISNADVPAARKLYKKFGFEMRRVEARRNINSKTARRGAVGELLVW